MADTFKELSDFHQYWQILRRRWLSAIVVLSGSVGLAAIITQLQPAIYQAEGKLLLNKVNRASSLTGLTEKIPELNSLTQQGNPLETEAEILRSMPLLKRVITSLKLRDETGAALSPKEFVKRLQVKSLRGTDVLQISFKGLDPKEAGNVVNLLMRLYMENNVQSNRAEATAAREFITNQLPKAEQTLRQAEATLRDFQERHQVVALEAEAQSAVARVAELESAMTQTQAQFSDAAARTSALQSQIGLDMPAAKALSTLSQAPAVQQVLSQYKQVETDLATQRSRYRDRHPAMIELRDRQAKLKTLLQSRVQETLAGQDSTVAMGAETALQMGNLDQKLTEELVRSHVAQMGLASQITTLNNSYTTYKQRIGILPELQQNLRELERRAQVAQTTYELMLKKLQEVRLTETQNLGNAKILSAALVPEKPIAPILSFNLMLGGAAGLVLAIGTALLLEAQDKSIHNIAEAKQCFGYTLLGTIPCFGKPISRRQKPAIEPPTLPVRDLPYSPISAAFSMLQANLRFLSSDRPIKVIAVTSSLPGEGKSSVSANLAVAAAQANQRVLIVDADMRRPCQQQIWELPNLVGLSNVLVGHVTVAAALEPVLGNIDVLPSGAMPPNPVALLDSKRVIALFEQLATQYDLIIIDTPPLTVATDAMLLGRIADGVLLIARPGVVNTASATAAKTMLAQSQQNVLGLVVNGFTPTDEPESYYYYGQSYNPPPQPLELATAVDHSSRMAPWKSLLNRGQRK